MSNWEGVAEFVATVEENSFTLAAQRLQTSVAQVSRKVSSLEERLSVRLLNRTTRKVTPTEAGMLYYHQCKPLLEGLAIAEQLVTQVQSQPKGRIRVTAPVTYGEIELAPVIHQFLAQHPLIDIELSLNNQAVNLVEQGYDLAIRIGRLGDSSLKARRLGERQVYTCASKAYLTQYGIPHSLDDLATHQCLVGSSSTWYFSQAGQTINKRISGRLQCNSGFALADAATRHLGIAQLPEHYVATALQQGKLIEVLSEYRNDKEGIWAVYPNTRHLTSRVRLLIDYLAEHLTSSQ